MREPDGLIETAFETGEVRLNVARAGSGPRLLLLHGATARWQVWTPAMPAFARSFSVIAPDMRGSGRSGRVARGAYGVMDQARDIVVLVDAEPDGPINVVGHSFGGHVGLVLAALRPGRVRRLVMEDVPLAVTNGRLAGRPAGQGFADWLALLNKGPDPEDVMAEISRQMPQASDGQKQARLQSLLALDPAQVDCYVNGAVFAGYEPHTLAGQVRCQALCLEADQALGARIEPGAGQLFCERAPDATRFVMAGAGHGIHTDMPEAFVDVVTAFLNEESQTEIAK